MPAALTDRQIFLRRDFRDFKPYHHLRVADFPTLLPLIENRKTQAGTMSESEEIVLLQTFAWRIRIEPGVFARLRSFAFNILKANRRSSLSQDRYRAAIGDLASLINLLRISER